jgi:DALR anticodon binding domain
MRCHVRNGRDASDGDDEDCIGEIATIVRAFSIRLRFQSIKKYDLLVVSIQSFRQLQSIKQKLQQKLSVSMGSCKIGGDRLDPSRIGLYRLNSSPEIAYRCAIALELAARSNLSPLTIAQQLVAGLPHDSELEFAARVLESGWLEFHLRDRTIALWLQQIVSGEWGDGETGRWGEELGIQNLKSKTEFPLQYAHARCCSLLRLGHREGIVQLDRPEETPPPWQWLNPKPIPWLISSEAASLRFNHPAEQNLIVQLSEAVDGLTGASRGDGFKLAQRTSEAMLEFYRSCRIWGEVKTQALELAQARLGLLAVTQVVLAQLLRQLGVEILTEV